MATPASKCCTKCGEVKPIELFYGNPHMVDGHASECKECKKAQVRITGKRKRDEWRTAHPLPPPMTPEERKEHKHAYDRQWAKDNPDKVIKKRQRYYEHHREAVLAHKAETYRSRPKEWWTEQKRIYRAGESYKVVRKRKQREDRAYRERNLEHLRNLGRLRYRKDIDAYRSRDAARRARRRNAPRVERISRKAIIERDKSICYICGIVCTEGVNLHLDHVIPLSRGGSHTADNLRVCCSTCNWRKASRLLDEMR